MKLLVPGVDGYPTYSGTSAARIRFLSNPYQYMAHSLLGQRIPCNDRTYGNEEICEYCNLGSLRYPRWIAGVIVRGVRGRNIDEYMILDFGYDLFNNVRELARHPD